MIARQKQPRPYPRSRRYQDQEPLPGSAALLRDNVSARRHELDERMHDPSVSVRDRLAVLRKRLDADEPWVLDLVAEVLDLFRAVLRGRVKRLRADRTERYFREGLLGGRELTLPNFFFALFSDRWLYEAFASWLDSKSPFTRHTPAHDLGSVGDEGKRLAEAAGRFSGGLVKAIEDGTISDHEAAQLERDLNSLEAAVTRSRAALVARRRA